MLAIRNIHAAYLKKEVLRGLSIEVRQGEIVALIGANGTGKSTLLRVVAGLLRPREGDVTFEGQSITGLAPHEVNAHGISYLLQGGEVFPNLAVRENLEMAGHRLNKATLRGRLPAIWDAFPKLKPLEGKRAGLLSGGEQQMLAIGMILIQQPKLMLLDEPSAALAPPLVEEILRLLKEYSLNIGSSVLLVEQNVRQAIKVCDRVYRLTDGTASEESKQEALFFLPGFMKKSN